MYRILGADQKEYGPVSADLIRQWINEGRANAQSMAKAEGEAEWRPLSAFPEFAPYLQTGAAPGGSTPYPRAALVPETVLTGRDYSLDIGGCISRAWELLKAHFWPIIGISLLIFIISAAINQAVSLISGPAVQGMVLRRRVTPVGVGLIFFTSLISSPVYMVLTGGLLKYYLKLIRGETATIGDAFSGFSPIAGQLILLGLVSSLLTLIGYALCIIPGIYLNVSWIFALPLVMDRQMNFWDAMELSRRVVGKHWFLVFAFLIVIGLLAVCGVIACCVGMFVTIPLATIAMMYAYEDIFSRQGP